MASAAAALGAAAAGAGGAAMGSSVVSSTVSGRHTTAAISNLLMLQNVMRKDPESYREEFLQQQRHYQSLLQVFRLQPDLQARDTHHFQELISFLAHVAPCYRLECAELPRELLSLVTDQATAAALTSALRRTIVQALILLGNRDMISRLELLPPLFRLFGVCDKPLRKLLFAHIVNDIKRLARGGGTRGRKNVKGGSGAATAANIAHTHVSRQKLMQSLQHFMYTMLRDDNVVAAKKSLDVMIELWRRRIWNDDKTVNAIAGACFSKHTKLLITALRFFLGVEFYNETGADDSDDDSKEAKERRNSMLLKELHKQSSSLRNVKRKKKREREIKRAASAIKRTESKSTAHSSVQIDYSAIQLLYDAQSFAERLFSQLKGTSQSFDIRLLMMNVISRLIGSHKLIVENFYPFLQKYMLPHQKNVTSVLVFLAQASHDLVPPELLSPCVKTLADNFVTDRSSDEVMTVGLNAIREVCARCPLVMTRSLLLDLAQYKKSKKKGVVMAARSLITLFREIAPGLLAKRDQGRKAAMALAAGHDGVPEYGAKSADSSVPGMEQLIELLQAEEEEKAAAAAKKAGKKGAAAGAAAAAAGDDDNDDAWNMEQKEKGSGSDDSDDEEEGDVDLHATLLQIDRDRKAAKREGAVEDDGTGVDGEWDRLLEGDDKRAKRRAKKGKTDAAPEAKKPAAAAAAAAAASSSGDGFMSLNGGDEDGDDDDDDDDEEVGAPLVADSDDDDGGGAEGEDSDGDAEMDAAPAAPAAAAKPNGKAAAKGKKAAAAPAAAAAAGKKPAAAAAAAAADADGDADGDAAEGKSDAEGEGEDDSDGDGEGEGEGEGESDGEGEGDDEDGEGEEDGAAAQGSAKRQKTAAAAAKGAAANASSASASSSSSSSSSHAAADAAALMATRILTPADFAKLKALQVRQQMGELRLSGGAAAKAKKRKLEEQLEQARTQHDGAVDEDTLTAGSDSKSRRDKLARQATVKEGRAASRAAANQQKPGKHGGKTNEEQKKNKPFMLQKYNAKNREKRNMSKHEKQQGVSGHLKKLKNQSKRLKKKLKRRPQ